MLGQLFLLVLDVMQLKGFSFPVVLMHNHGKKLLF